MRRNLAHWGSWDTVYLVQIVFQQILKPEALLWSIAIELKKDDLWQIIIW